MLYREGKMSMSFLQTLFHTHLQTQPKTLLASEQKTCGYYCKPLGDPREIFLEAGAYLHLFHQECGKFDAYAGRLAEIHREIKYSGTYWQTYDELAYGAKVAWRNNTRCIGRLHWNALTVRDMRHAETADQIYAALVDHLRLATNGGKIRSTITIFAPAAPGQPGIRIWNPQLIRYAGYRQPDGSIIGDPAHAELTDIVRRLGWTGSARAPFDVLPLVIQLPGQLPRMFELPRDVVLEVPISHPDYPWFLELGLKWHANLLPLIAKKMGLDTSSDRTLWRDRALVELNVAVLSSFAQHGVTIVDHHTASRQFMCHEKLEKKAGRSVPGHWVWLVPPVSGSTSPIFHVTTYKNTILKPNFFYQPAPWRKSQPGEYEGL